MEKNGQASNVDYGEENPTGPNYTKICGHKFHKYVQHMLRKQAEQICSEMDKVMQLLLKNSQAAWILMSTSAMAHQLDYNLTLQYPGDMLESANMVDNHPPRPFGGYFKRFFNDNDNDLHLCQNDYCTYVLDHCCCSCLLSSCSCGGCCRSRCNCLALTINEVAVVTDLN